MSDQLRITPVKMAVHRQGTNPVFGEAVITIEIIDEAAGPFFVIESNDDELRIDVDELEVLVQAGKTLLAEFQRNTEGIDTNE